jgi:tetratricopeptide (TPR) repeat protein
MRYGFLHKIFLIGIVLISSLTFAQKNNSVEENNLKFQTYFFEALKQKAIKNYSKAIINLEKCYEIDSTNFAVYFELSKNYFLLKNHNEAHIFIDKALEKEPDNIFLLKHKITIYNTQRNLKNAIELQKKLIQIEPHYSDELVLLYIQNKNFDKAEKLIDKIEKNGLRTTRIKGFKKYLENRKTDSIKVNSKQTPVKNRNIETLKKLYAEKKNFNVLKELLIMELSNDLFEFVYSDSKEGLEIFPAQPFLYKMNGIALNKLGKYNEAISVLTIGIDFVIDNNMMEADFYDQLSISHEGLNNKSEALKCKQKANQLRQEN